MVPLPHAPYSPDLAPCDFLLFPRMKRGMNGHRFDIIEEEEELSAISNDDYKKKSNSGSTGGINVLVVMGSILKGMALKNSFGYFWVPPRIRLDDICLFVTYNLQLS